MHSMGYLQAIRNEFQNSRSILVNYALGAVLKFLLSTALLVGLCFAMFGTLVKCGYEDGGGGLRCSFINYILCPFAKVQFSCIVPHTQFYFYLAPRYGY